MIRNSVEKWTSSAAARVQALAARNRMQLETPMKFENWLYVLAVLLAGVWTLGLWGVYALLGLGDEGLRAGSSLFEVDPRTLEWISSFVGGTQQLGGVLLIIVWVLGVLLLVIGSWLARRLIRSFSKAASSGDSHVI
jgi:Zn-dependent protease with chaperone function